MWKGSNIDFNAKVKVVRELPNRTANWLKDIRFVNFLYNLSRQVEHTFLKILSLVRWIICPLVSDNSKLKYSEKISAFNIFIIDMCCFLFQVGLNMTLSTLYKKSKNTWFNSNLHVQHYDTQPTITHAIGCFLKCFLTHCT